MNPQNSHVLMNFSHEQMLTLLLKIEFGNWRAYREFGWKSKSELNMRPNMVSGLEVKRDGDTTKRVPSTNKVIFSPSLSNCWLFAILDEVLGDK